MMGIKIDTHRTGAVWLLINVERNNPVFFFFFWRVWRSGVQGVALPGKGGREGRDGARGKRGGGVRFKGEKAKIRAERWGGGGGEVADRHILRETHTQSWKGRERWRDGES